MKKSGLTGGKAPKKETDAAGVERKGGRRERAGKKMEDVNASGSADLSFLDFVISGGYVSTRDADAVRVLQESRFFFGVIALREKLISIDQLERALAEQEKERPRRLIGEILVEMGYLSKGQVDQVLDKKKFAAEHQADLLVDTGMMSKGETSKALKEYMLREGSRRLK